MLESISDSNECPRCGSKLQPNALFCGKCGTSLSDSQENVSRYFPEENSSWQWISPAIWLWISLLIINGILGLSGYFLDITDPFYRFLGQGASAICIVIPCFLSRRQMASLLNNFGRNGFISFVQVIGALIFIYLLMWLYIKLFTLIGVEEISYLKNFKKHHWPLWTAFVLICFFPGVLEELAFRGYIMSRLEGVGSEKEALIIQAGMFSVLHMLPTVFISHFIMGLVFGFVRLKSRSLYPGMIIHVGWNSIVIMKEANLINIFP